MQNRFPLSEGDGPRHPKILAPRHGEAVSAILGLPHTDTFFCCAFRGVGEYTASLADLRVAMGLEAARAVGEAISVRDSEGRPVEGKFETIQVRRINSA